MALRLKMPGTQFLCALLVLTFYCEATFSQDPYPCNVTAMVVSGRVVDVTLDLPDPLNCTSNTVVQFTGRRRLCVSTLVNTSITIMNVTGCEAMVVELEPYTDYFSVKVSEELCVLNNNSTLMTGEEAPSGVPQNFSVEQINSTQVNLTWTEVNCTDRNGNITHYLIFYNESDGSSENMTNITTLSFIVLNLADGEYVFGVAAVNSVDRGPFAIISLTLLTSTSSTDTPTMSTSTMGPSSQVDSSSTPFPSSSSPPPSSSSPPSPSKVPFSSSAVAGIVIGVLAVVFIFVVIVLILLLVVIRKRQKVKSTKARLIELDRPDGGVAREGRKAFEESKIERSPNSTEALDDWEFSANDAYETLQPTPPVVGDYHKEVQVWEGQEVTLKLEVSGFPRPTIKWTRDSAPVDPDFSSLIGKDGSVTFICVEMSRSGMYHFVAKNIAGKVEGNVTLVVQSEEEETGLDRVDSKPVQLADFGEYLSGKHSTNNAGFICEFHSLPSGEERKHSTIALMSQNVSLNRFRNISPYDEHRIVLEPLEGFTDCQHDFMNASYIDGYSKEKKFIATQGPLPGTITDFWRLVWQENVQVVVMVTNLIESMQRKCEQYWPSSGSQSSGPFTITLTEQQVFADYVIRTFALQFSGGDSGASLKKVTQLHFTSWPDHGVPEYAGPVLAFHRRTMALYKPSKGPILIHCSAGVGRTGTFISIDVALEQAQEKSTIDVPAIVTKTRRQRMKMVQTMEQYMFIHDAVLESLICGTTQINAADLKSAIAELGEKDEQSGKNGFETQFNVLGQVSCKPEEVARSVAMRLPAKNRSMEFLPSDFWRVILRVERPDYISASFASGYKQYLGYIIAQAPLETTCRDFLKMVLERECGVIVMLSQQEEEGEELCYPYWPVDESDRSQKFGEFIVNLLEEKEHDGFKQRILGITDPKAKAGQVHKVSQFHLGCWTPEGLCTNPKALMEVIEQVGVAQRRSRNKPIVVHGKDTVSRCGVFCSLINTIECCKTEGIVDVFQMVKALRIQKPGAVCTVDQYTFIFDMTKKFLDSFSIYSNFK